MRHSISPALYPWISFGDSPLLFSNVPSSCSTGTLFLIYMMQSAGEKSPTFFFPILSIYINDEIWSRFEKIKSRPCRLLGIVASRLFVSYLSNAHQIIVLSFFLVFFFSLHWLWNAGFALFCNDNARCVPQPCPELVDFRLQQCQSYNSIPYQVRKQMHCLVCTTTGVTFYCPTRSSTTYNTFSRGAALFSLSKHAARI